MSYMEVLSTRNNKVMLWRNCERSCVVKSYKNKRRSLTFVKYTLLAAIGREVPVEYRCAADRRTFEQQTLQFWRRHGFRAPAEVPVPNDIGGEGVVLAQESLAGPTLDALLNDPRVLLDDKWRTIVSVLGEMRERHSTALYMVEHRLIHYDSNMRNVILTQDGPARVDFEMGHLQEKIDTSAAREVQKLSLEIANSLGGQHLPALVEKLCANYGIRHVLRLTADKALRRPFAGHHFRRDTKRKALEPGLVTKCDLARAIQEFLAPSDKLSHLMIPTVSTATAGIRMLHEPVSEAVG